jgi:Domain of unknown function (DUF1707)
MTGPADGTGAVGPDRRSLRASHADREQVVDALKAAFVQGRLAKDEFDARVGQAFAARTYAQLAAVTSDLPAAAVWAQPPGQSRIKASAGAITVASALVAGGWTGTWLAHAGNPEVIVLLISLTLILSGAWLLTGLVALLESRQRTRSPTQLPSQA